MRFHDFSYLPLPGLRREMLAAAVDTHLLRSVLEACRRSPGQRKTGETVLASLQAREVCQLLKSRQFSDCGELKGDWLAGLQDDDKRLQSLAETSRFLLAADQATVPRYRLQQIQRAKEILTALRNQFLSDRSHESADFLQALETADAVTAAMHDDAVALMKDQLPNAFRTGDPLQPKMGQETFRGRDDLVRQAELLLNGGRGRGCARTTPLRQVVAAADASRETARPAVRVLRPAGRSRRDSSGPVSGARSSDG